MLLSLSYLVLALLSVIGRSFSALLLSKVVGEGMIFNDKGQPSEMPGVLNTYIVSAEALLRCCALVWFDGK